MKRARTTEDFPVFPRRLSDGRVELWTHQGGSGRPVPLPFTRLSPEDAESLSVLLLDATETLHGEPIAEPVRRKGHLRLVWSAGHGTVGGAR